MSIFKKAQIGRFDEALAQVPFREGDKVEALLEKAGIELSEGEEVNDANGNKIEPTATATEQDYFVVGNYKNGIFK